MTIDKPVITIAIAASNANPVETSAMRSSPRSVRQPHDLPSAGTSNTLTATGGTETVQANLGSNTITTGTGNDTIRFAGSNNVIDAGSGNNVLYRHRQQQ